MKTIAIRRPKESFNKNCIYEILIDGKKLTELKYGEQKTLEIPDNSKFIKAKFLPTSSKTIALNNNKSILVTGDKFLNKMGPFIGGIILLFSLSFILNHQYKLIKYAGITLTVTAIIFSIAVLTIWRNRWLDIQYET